MTFACALVSCLIVLAPQHRLSVSSVDGTPDTAARPCSRRFYTDAGVWLGVLTLASGDESRAGLFRASSRIGIKPTTTWPGGRILNSNWSFGFQEIAPNLRGRTPVLTYHDVIDTRDSQALWFDVTTGELEQQLDWLKAHGAHFVTIGQLYRHLTTGVALPRHAIAITFADNYLGFYTRAWPVLRRRGVPVAMFVHTGYVGDQHGRPKMSWAQLSELDRSGLVTVASQTVTHPADLRTLSKTALAGEMAGSKRSLEAHLGHSISFLAYPNGKFDGRVAVAARRAGYRMAFTEECRPAENTRSILLVPRYVHTKYRNAWREAYGGAER